MTEGPSLGGQQICHIRRIAGGVINNFAGTGTCGYSGDGGAPVAADIIALDISTDSSGAVYFADIQGRVRKIANGMVTTVAGTGVQGFSGDGGSAVSAQLSSTRDVAVALNGDLYVVDTGNRRVRRVSSGVIDTVAGGGPCCPSGLGDGGPATLAFLGAPTGVAVDAFGNLYVTDWGYSMVRVVYGSGPCVDVDCDGVIAALDDCPTTANEDQLNTDAANAAANRPGSDADGNACDADADGDGYSDAAEGALGKDPLGYCSIMRADIDGDGVVSILDLSAAAQHFAEAIPPAPIRDAQDADTSISILDLSRMAGVFTRPVSACS